MQELKQYKTPDGWWTSDVDITSEEWVSLLRNDAVIRPEARKWLLRFYAEKDHVSSCLLLGKKFSVEPRVINAVMTNCGRTIQKHLNRFVVLDDEEEGNHYLTILTLGKSGGKSGFQLKVRPELCDALHEYLIETLLDEFANQVIPVGLGKEPGIDEIYKWVIVSDCQGKDDAQILQRLIGTNLINNQFDGAAIKKLLQSEPEEIAHCFSMLKGELAGLQGRYNSFKQETDALTGDRWKYQISDERMAGSYLACVDPEHYTFYKNDTYTSLCNYLRVPAMAPRKKLCHFYELIAELLTHFEKHPELVSFFEKETEGYVQSPLLNVQTIVWFMQDYMNKQTALDTRFTWVPFVKEFSEKLLTFRDKRDELISIFYGISDELTHAYQEDGENINDITPFTVLGTLAVGKTERRTQFATYFKDKLGIEADVPTDYTGFPSLHPQRVMFIFGKNKAEHTEPFWDLFDAALNGKDISIPFDEVMKVKGANRNVSMGLFWVSPKSFLSLDSTNENYLKHYGFPPIPGKSKITSSFYSDLMTQVKEKMDSGDIKEKDFLEFSANAYSFGNGIIDNSEIDEDMDEFSTLLKNNYNLILTGAPGTGKTYMAKRIACQMVLGKPDFNSLDKEELAFFNEHCKLVQFHPSYDYSDFVEGLRPYAIDKSQIGFHRENGVMKKLCEAALLNLQEAAKTGTEQREEQDTKTKALTFIDTAIGDNLLFETKTGKKFTVVSVDDNAFYVSSPDAGEELIRVPLKNLYILLTQKHPEKVTDIRSIIGRKRTQQYDSYLYSISERIRQSVDAPDVAVLNDGPIATEKVKRESFVLIIDEINRGELSKIFGELFFAIDPGYRGVSGKVQTQYQNLVEEDDVFYEGFFVPENVYIIGTMNDIDRGVESMDFAIRRRFGWYEVTAESRTEMLDERIPAWSGKARNSMASLNKAIESKDIGLSPAYHIGPAYYLRLAQYNGNFESLWQYHIKGVLSEYLRGTRGIEDKLTILKDAFNQFEKAE